MTKFLYWDEDLDRLEDLPTVSKIRKQPKLKGEYVRERDTKRTHQSEKELYPEE